MRKEILTLTIVCFFISLGQAEAFVSMGNHVYYPNDIATATGTVQATGRNSIKIYDEDRKRSEMFIYLGNYGSFQKGDYIRIYYHPETAFVVTIKRMTVLEYKKDGQNLGNIFHQSSP